MKHLIVLLLGTYLMGCAVVDSEDIKTGAFCAYYSASRQGTAEEVHLRAKYTAGCGLGASYIELSSGDEVYAQVGNRQVKLSKDNNIVNQIDYNRTINLKAGEKVNFILRRSSDSEDEVQIVESTVVMAGSVKIKTDSGFKLKKGDPLRIDWESNMDNTTFAVYLDGNYKSETEDSSTYSSRLVGRTKGKSFMVSGGETIFKEAKGSVSSEVRVSLNINGELNSSFEGGHISSSASDSIKGQFVD